MKEWNYKGLPFCYYKNFNWCLEPAFLDIETANNHAEKPEDLITWIVSIQVYFADQYYLFRYPEELIEWYQGIIKKYNIDDKHKFITFIHNASYDLSYLIPYLNMLPDFDNNNQGIIDGVNKFISYARGGLEWRCSYRLSGKSLEKWSDEYNIEHKKLVGLYDYDKILYPDSKLNESESDYDKIDVIALYECAKKQAAYHGDNLATIPLTSTGYVRRELRKACRKDKYFREHYFLNNQLNADLYTFCLKAYAGGMTHNNRFYRDITISLGNIYDYCGHEISVNRIRHRDFKSHYPTQMACMLFPLGKPQKIYTNDMPFNMTIPDILAWYPKFSSISVIRFYEAKLKDISISMPFMQFSKCYEAKLNARILDNGRILYCSGQWIMYLDNLTLQILNEQYNMDYEILEVYRMKNDYLPDCMISVIDQYFKGKSDKKNIVNDLTAKYGKLDNRTREAEFELMQCKKFINAIYGCTATNPLRDQLEITEDIEFRYKQTYTNHDEIEEGLKEYYNKRNNFLAYQIGVFVTAYARFELYEFIKCIGYSHCLYADTDSLFYISTPEIESRIDSLNEEKRKKAHYVILDNGEIEYYDQFNTEPDIKAFKGLHAKCYGIVTDTGLELTIAGVPARTLIGMENNKPIYYTREEELQGDISDPIKALDNLKDDFEFTVNAGVSALYIGATGYNTERKPTILNINGHEVHTAGGCVIRKLKSKKVHGLSDETVQNGYFIDNYDIDSLL